MKSEKKFPEFLFVTVVNEGDEEEYLSANKVAKDAVEDDGPTTVATYRRVEINTLSKRVVSHPTR